MTDDHLVLFQMIDRPNEAQERQEDRARSWELDHPVKSDRLVEEDRRLINLPNFFPY